MLRCAAERGAHKHVLGLHERAAIALDGGRELAAVRVEAAEELARAGAGVEARAEGGACAPGDGRAEHGAGVRRWVEAGALAGAGHRDVCGVALLLVELARGRERERLRGLRGLRRST